jgi:hypothetical protein
MAKELGSFPIYNKKLEYDKMIKSLQQTNKNAIFNKVPLPPNLAQIGET